MPRVLATLMLILCLVAAPSAQAQIVSPAPGTEMPPEVLESIQGKGMFEFRHAWIEKTRNVREARERYVAERGAFKGDLLQAGQRQQLVVSGNFAIPVFCVRYSDSPAMSPTLVSQLQTKLFTGPFAPQTMTQFYSEISYGDLSVTGTVYGWTNLPQTNAYYTGTGTCNGLCGTARIPQLINSTLTANDALVNFGQYDNDGPDGVPNSGDDDGYVDFVSFVHPEQGAECGVNGNIWSHRFSLSGWGAAPFTTNDNRTGGGKIIVDDYTIQPIYNCGGATLIDIGVFCHEFGHAFGLPDLYDTNGGSQGVGHWCLMGSGNWNTPTQPAHMSAWSKYQLGWTNILVAPATPTPFSIFDVETNRDVVRLDVMHEKWRRLTDCAIAGTQSMRCGLLAAEATARNWAGGSGYGNYWDTTVSRDFYYNGVGSVGLQYQYAFDLEPSYDFAYGEITVGATKNTFALYNGTGSGVQSVDLTPYLSGPTAYTISFRVTSDGGWSDEDGSYATLCGAMVLDDIYVTGGGESFFTDFETREDGWAETMNPPTEYFLVENRKPIGSDVNVWGGGGLAIWHIDSGDQTGGPSNNRPRGVALEQADGLGDLEAGFNRGDGGDPYPGSSNNLNFNGFTVPNSNGHDGPSTVSVQLTSGNGNPITATMMGGWPAPLLTSVTPGGGTSGNLEQLQIDGALFAKTGLVELVDGPNAYGAMAVKWLGKDRILADFDLTGVPNGVYDVVVYNPGGASAVLVDAYTVTGAPTAAGELPSKFALSPNYPNPFNPATTIRYQVPSRLHVQLRVYDVSGAVVRTLVDEAKAAGAYSLQWDGRDDRGTAVSSGVYFYRLTAGEFSDVRKMTLVK